MHPFISFMLGDVVALTRGPTTHQQSMIDLASVLKLPLTADARAMQTAEMGRRYYNVLMAGAY